MQVYTAFAVQKFYFFIYGSYHQQQKVSSFTKSVLLVWHFQFDIFLKFKDRQWRKLEIINFLYKKLRKESTKRKINSAPRYKFFL